MVQIDKLVSQSEVGGDLRMKYWEIIRCMQDCSFVHLSSQHPLDDEFRERNMGMFLTSRQCTLFKAPVFNQRIIIRTWVYELNTVMGYRNTVVYDRDSEEVLAASMASGAFVDMSSGMPAHISEQSLAAILIEDKMEGLQYMSRKVPAPKTGGIPQEPIKIRQSDTDTNRHANNAQYIRMICDCFEGEIYPSFMRAEYKTPCKLGDIITPTIYPGPDKTNIVLRNERGDVCLSAELAK